MNILFKPQPKYPHYHHIWNSLYFYISIDFPIYLPTTNFFVQTFFLEKVWLEDTLPTYSLDICPKFRSFFLWDSLLGLKFCWVVVSCPKRFFVKKNNIGMVNPGRGGVDDPPPQKIVGLNCVWLLLVLLGDAA